MSTNQLSDAQHVFEARIGSWKKVIKLANLQPPPDIFFSVLSFSMTQVSPENELTPDIHFVYSPLELKSNSFHVTKQNRKIFWQKGFRHIAQQKFSIKIDQFFSTATFYGDIEWEMVVDLLESWIGHLYEVERGVRLHAVAFNEFILIAKSGFGKTHLAFNHWNELIADEVVYVNGLEIENHFTSVRLKKAGHWTTRYGQREVHGKRVQPCQLPAVYLDNSSLLSVFLGIGLPQYLEFAFSLRYLLDFFLTACRRIYFIYQVRLWQRPRLDRAQAEQMFTDQKKSK